MSIDNSGPGVPRRGLLLGAGAAGLAAAGAGAAPAVAAPVAPKGGAAARRTGSPITSTIASAPLAGYTYRYANWMDFVPEAFESGRSWGFFGVYTNLVAGNLWATFDVPPGALIRDIEWYIYNVSPGNVTLFGRLWGAGTGTVFNSVLDLTAAPTGGSVVTVRGSVPSTLWGPYPTGVKLALGLTTTSDGNIQVNGARVGFTKGNGGMGLLPTPVRAYDSRVTGGAFAAGETRAITLPAGVRPAGVSGALLNVTATGATAPGFLTVYPYGGASPGTSSLYYATSAAVCNSVTVGVSVGGKINVTATAPTHVVIDVNGIIS